MTIFEIFLALAITSFLILFAIAVIFAFANHKDIKRLYKFFSILRDRESRDDERIRKIIRYIGGGRNGKPE